MALSDGGPAFPGEHVDQELRAKLMELRDAGIGMTRGELERIVRTHPGMSLEDFFAGCYLIGARADDTISSYADTAKYAYDMAEAMVAEREARRAT